MKLDRKLGKLILAEAVTVEHATELKEKLLALLNGDTQTITVEMGKVADVDVAAIQLLYAAHQSCKAFQKSLVIENIPEILTEKLEKMSLEFPGVT